MHELRVVSQNEGLAQEALYTKRLEARFKLPMADLSLARTTLQSIMSEEQFSGQTVDSLYYGTEHFRMPYFLRVRTYSGNGQQNRTFFEIKRTKEGETIKDQAPFPDYQDGQIINTNPLVSFLDKIDWRVMQNVFLCLQDDNSSPLYPFIGTTTNRFYFRSDSENIRATIDTDTRYRGYYAQKRTEAHQIGEEKTARFELKAQDQATINTIAQVLTSAGVHLEPAQASRKESLQKLYFKTRSLLKEDEGIFDEVPGYEIEGKIQIIPPYEDPFILRYEANTLNIVDRIAEGINIGVMPNISLPEGMNIRQVDSQLILFGEYNGQRLEEGLIVVTDTLANLYALKRKLPLHPETNTAVLARSEPLKKILIGQFEGETRKQHLKEIEEMIKSRLYEVGTLEKLKRFITLKHASQRYYDLSVSKISYGNDTTYQIEVEYKGRGLGFHYSEFSDRFEGIAHEIDEIRHYILRRFSGKVEPTTLSNFDWLIKTRRDQLLEG